jgi:hypothetical protein
VERGRKELAPTVDLVAYLPTLSLPLQGGDLGPTVSAEEGSPAQHERSVRPRVSTLEKGDQGPTGGRSSCGEGEEGNGGR